MSKKYEFPVENVRTFSYKNEAKRFFAEARVGDLPKALPLDVNAREQNLRSGVSRAIRRSLGSDEASEIFHLLNRGIVLTVAEANYNNQTGKMTIEIEDPKIHGVLDGGHTYRIVSEDQYGSTQARVLLEILTGVEDFQAEIVAARNTSIQVEEYALLNVKDAYETILARLDETGIGRDSIRVKMNGDEEIPILDILAIMYMFDVDEFSNDVDGMDNPPVLAYARKGSVLAHFKAHPERFKEKLLPLLPDILYLWDYIALRLLPHYRAGTGNKTGRPGGRRGNDTVTYSGLFMPNLVLEYMPHRAYRLPMMAALRCLIDDSGPVYAWKDVKLPGTAAEVRGELGRPATRIERFYELVAPMMHRVLWAEADQSNPTRLGKQNMLWNNLYTIAWRELSKLQ